MPNPDAALRRTRLLTGLALIAVLVPCAIAVVQACGPDFPSQLLENRAATLRTMPQGSFAYTVARLVPADPHPAAPNPPPEPAAGPAMRLYGRATDAWAAAHTGEAAQAGYSGVLDLPPAIAAPRAVAAAFMLGRIHLARLAAGQDAAAEHDRAVAAFEQARGLARTGSPDPDNLAATAYGEQARLYLRNGAALCDWTSFPKRDVCAEAIAPADLATAIGLYAHQAADGDDSGVNSLAFIADWALADGKRVAALIDDPVARHVLVAYALARVDDLAPATTEAASGPADASPPGTPPVTPPVPVPKPDPRLAMLAGAIRARGLMQVDGADRLAALAYRAQDDDMARMLAARATTPLAFWVRAKLALRDGDMAAAAADYAEAVRHFPAPDDALDPDTANRLKGEQGVLALSRGEYVQAFAILYAAAQQAGPDSGVSEDAAYVAERVLRTDELKAYVDASIPATAAPPAHAPATPGAAGPETDAPAPVALADMFRALLARRLVRDGRLGEAIAYFPADDDPRFATAPSDGAPGAAQPFRRWTRDYAEALGRAHDAWRRVARAQAWFDAAAIVRRHGMEIMGTEQDPDYAFTGGEYTFGAGRGVVRYGNDGTPYLPPTPQARAQQALPGPFVQPGERSRFIASEAAPYVRYHYRAVAAAYAERAAGLLPPRSRAFAATLCKAAEWAPERAPALYRRYVREGAHVAFARDFGQACDAPDFHAAARFGYVEATRTVRHALHRVWPALAGATVIAGFGLLWLRQRRRMN